MVEEDILEEKMNERKEKFKEQKEKVNEKTSEQKDKYEETKEKTTNTITNIEIEFIKTETSAVINEAIAKFKKNILGVKISKIKKPIPNTDINCHKAIINTLFKIRAGKLVFTSHFYYH